MNDEIHCTISGISVDSEISIKNGEFTWQTPEEDNTSEPDIVDQTEESGSQSEVNDHQTEPSSSHNDQDEFDDQGEEHTESNHKDERDTPQPDGSTSQPGGTVNKITGTLNLTNINLDVKKVLYVVVYCGCCALMLLSQLYGPEQNRVHVCMRV